MQHFHLNVSVSSYCVSLNLFCSQKRKSEDLNGEATNGQTEVKKEEDEAEEVTLFHDSVISFNLISFFSLKLLL